MLWAKVGLKGPLARPSDRLGWPGSQVSWPHQHSHLVSSSSRLNMIHVDSIILLVPSPGFLPCHLLLSYYLRLPLVLDIMKICMDFGPYDAFLLSDVLEMVDQQNSWNSLVIDTYLLYLA
jgi:hypothetical protein